MSSKVLIIILVLEEGFLSGLGGRMCSKSQETVTHVDQCPFNKEEWERRELTFKCNEINQNCSSASEFTYHCIRDSSGKLVELCAPFTDLKGKKCPEFNYGGSRIQEDNSDSGYCERCPFSYSSKAVFNYRECLVASYDASTTSKDQNKDESSETKMTLVIACIASVFTIIVMILVCIWCMRKKRKGTKEHDGALDEMEIMSTCNPQDVKGKEEDDVIADVDILNESEEVFPCKLRDDKHALQQQKEERVSVTLSGIYYKGKFS